MALIDSIQSMSAPLMQQLSKITQSGNLSPQDMKDLESLKAEGSKFSNQMMAQLNKNLPEMGLPAGGYGKVPSVSASNFVSHGGGNVQFGSLLKQAVHYVDGKQKTAANEAQAVFTGQSDNLHQAVLAMREGQLALNLLVEVRNHLMEGMQELARMQIG